MVKDAPILHKGWSPRNFDGRFSGSVTLREALARSLNTATVRLALSVGIAKRGGDGATGWASARSCAPTPRWRSAPPR